MRPSSSMLKMSVEKPESPPPPPLQLSNTPYESEKRESPSKNEEESSLMLKKAMSVAESMSELAMEAHPDVGLE